jgi:glycosyltransferase involved in cell wall biosynthesis
MEKLLSVILPVYNTEVYFRACLESLLPQLDERAEVIIMDDGCTDGCPKIMEEYRRRYPDIIKVLHEENRGNTVARYAALREARGLYVGFLDSDDLVENSWYEDIISVIESYYPDMILLRWQKFDDEGHLFETERPPLFDTGEVDKDDIMKVFVSSQRVNGLPLKVVKRELFTDDTDCSDNGKRTLMEDKLMSIQLFENAETFWYIPHVLYLYRTNLSSITLRTHENEHYTLQYTYPPMLEFLKRTGYDLTPYHELLVENYGSVMWEIILKTHRTFEREKEMAVFREMRGFEFTGYMPALIGDFKLADYKKEGLRLLLKEDYAALYDFISEIRKNPDLDHRADLRKLGKL